jgi:hypothetical protein
MSLSTRINNGSEINGDILEKVILQNDLSGLKPLEKVQYITGICKTLGLNPSTQPIALMKFNGKEVPYVRKDGTEQLRQLHKVSVVQLDTEMLENSIYVVTARAKLPDGREDSSTGVISVAGLKGENLSNAMMKAETKAKRRVTLSICGLGFIDETEVDSIPNAIKVNPYANVQVKVEQPTAQPLSEAIAHLSDQRDLDSDLLDISQCKTELELQNLFKVASRYYAANNIEALKKLIDAKDKKKEYLKKESDKLVEEYNQEIDSVNVTTGEVFSHESN